MDLDRYVLVRSDQGWELRLNGRSLGLFEDLPHAKRAARVAARMSRRRGRTAEVLIYDGPDEATAPLIERLTCGGTCEVFILACSSVGYGWHLPGTLMQRLH